MTKLLQKIKVFLSGGENKVGFMMSSAPDPEPKTGETPRRDALGKPPIQTTGFDIKADPDARRPDGEGWYRVSGGWARTVKGGSGSEMSEVEDAPAKRPHKLNQGFRYCRKCRAKLDNLDAIKGYCIWCR